MDKSLFQIVKAQDELDGKEGVVVAEENDHLFEGDFHDTSSNFPIPAEEEFVDANHTSSNSFEMDDDELLTSDLDAVPLETKNDRVEMNEMEGLTLVHNHDDDDFSDEDLLAD